MSTVRDDLDVAPGILDLPRARLRGRHVRLQARVNTGEVTRRQIAGLGALTHAPLLTLLAMLPHQESFAWSLLDERSQRALRSAPEGVVARVGSLVKRLVVSPLDVESIVVEARVGRLGLEAASTFAPFCQRSVLLPLGAVDNEVQLEATFYGIGVLVRDGNAVRTVVAPAPFIRRRWTWASWQFQEEAWQEVQSR